MMMGPLLLPNVARVEKHRLEPLTTGLGFTRFKALLPFEGVCGVFLSGFDSFPQVAIPY
jgi:hypothetical protein